MPADAILEENKKIPDTILKIRKEIVETLLKNGGLKRILRINEKLPTQEGIYRSLKLPILFNIFDYILRTNEEDLTIPDMIEWLKNLDAIFTKLIPVLNPPEIKALKIENDNKLDNANTKFLEISDGKFNLSPDIPIPTIFNYIKNQQDALYTKIKNTLDSEKMRNYLRSAVLKGQRDRGISEKESQDDLNTEIAEFEKELKDFRDGDQSIEQKILEKRAYINTLETLPTLNDKFYDLLLLCNHQPEVQYIKILDLLDEFNTIISNIKSHATGTGNDDVAEYTFSSIKDATLFNKLYRVRVLYKEPEEWKERVEILTEEIKKLKKVVVAEWVNHLEEIMAPMHAERYLKKIVIDETDTPGVRAKKKKDEEVRVARLDAEAARVVKEEKKKYLPLVKKYLAEVVEELRVKAEHDAKAGDFGKVMATYDEALKLDPDNGEIQQERDEAARAQERGGLGDVHPVQRGTPRTSPQNARRAG